MHSCTALALLLASASCAAAVRVEFRVEEWPSKEQVMSAEVLKTLKGGTHPALVNISGTQYVRKSDPRGDDIGIALETLASSIYAQMGTPAPDCHFYFDTQPAYQLCRFIPGLTPLVSFDDAVKSQVKRHFVLDALIQNYDLSGNLGNIALDGDGTAIRIDNGGALSVFALGGWKFVHYDCAAQLRFRIKTWSLEPFTLWDFQSNTFLYGNMSADEIIEQSREVIAKKDSILSVFSEQFQDERRHLEARIDCLNAIIESQPLMDLTAAPETLQNGLPKNICEGVRSQCQDILGKIAPAEKNDDEKNSAAN
eukprot:gb/GFBE01029606.1/.p1 GENE.gb/GFBE01029606.1/~~gb/GFBE01029606.1/.p1  ORF type:complete len:310 (+),score=68.30 gb/GFBE01029606.1/:1-930(+)